MEPRLVTALEGRYAIDREIGRGGMATVYWARDVRHNRRVALKVLNPELGAVLGVERFAPDRRFLMLKRAGAEAQTIVVHHWGRELREKVAPRR